MTEWQMHWEWEHGRSSWGEQEFLGIFFFVKTFQKNKKHSFKDEKIYIFKKTFFYSSSPWEKLSSRDTHFIINSCLFLSLGLHFVHNNFQTQPFSRSFLLRQPPPITAALQFLGHIIRLGKNPQRWTYINSILCWQRALALHFPGWHGSLLFVGTLNCHNVNWQSPKSFGALGDGKSTEMQNPELSTNHKWRESSNVFRP